MILLVHSRAELKRLPKIPNRDPGILPQSWIKARTLVAAGVAVTERWPPKPALGHSTETYWKTDESGRQVVISGRSQQLR